MQPNTLSKDRKVLSFQQCFPTFLTGSSKYSKVSRPLITIFWRCEEYFVKPVKTPTTLLSRLLQHSYSTSIALLQHFYSTPTALLSRLLQHSCQDSYMTLVKTPTALLSRILQHSCQDSYSTPVKRLQRKCLNT